MNKGGAIMILDLTIIEKGADGVENLLKQYDAKFPKPFPRFFVRHESEEFIVREIKSCLKSGKPFDPYKGIEGDPADILF